MKNQRGSSKSRAIVSNQCDVTAAFMHTCVIESFLAQKSPEDSDLLPKQPHQLYPARSTKEETLRLDLNRRFNVYSLNSEWDQRCRGLCAGLAFSLGCEGGLLFTVAHELLHSVRPLDKALSNLLLCSVGYMHWTYSHLAHHRNVMITLSPSLSCSPLTGHTLLAGRSHSCPAWLPGQPHVC